LSHLIEKAGPASGQFNHEIFFIYSFLLANSLAVVDHLR